MWESSANIAGLAVVLLSVGRYASGQGAWVVLDQFFRWMATYYGFALVCIGFGAFVLGMIYAAFFAPRTGRGGHGEGPGSYGGGG